MYADPLTIYREYVQNCADALDDAREAGHDVSAGPHVSIWFDHGARTVRIRDVGIGVPNDEFVRRLTAVGASGKRGKLRRGFRGVGRLSGLGYCQELIFRSRSQAAEKVKELRWDSRALRERLRDASFAGSLAELISEIVTVATIADSSHYPARFFEVELVKVLRIRNDVLMNEEEVRQHLAQVAPVPFAPAFPFGDEVASWLVARGLYTPLHIELNDDRGPIYHRAAAEVSAPRQPTIRFSGVEFIEIKNSAGEPLAMGWLLAHDYTGAISRASRVAGIRLRCRGVQVGGEDILASVFVEPRFASWVTGDLHVVHPRIVPNGRRDEFEVSAAHNELQDELRTLAKRLTQTIRMRSEMRRRSRRINLTVAQANDWLEVARSKRFHATTRRVALERGLDALSDVERVSKKGESDGGLHEDIVQLRKSLEKLRNTLALPPHRGRPPASTSKGAHAAVEAILSSSAQLKRNLPIAERVLAALEGRALAKG
jgi:molecular chaperone HtpG